jgi:hypothetical protein
MRTGDTITVLGKRGQVSAQVLDVRSTAELPDVPMIESEQARAILAGELMRVLAITQGNQCALVTSRHAPCTLDMAGDPAPDLKNCEWAGSQRAEEFRTFETANMGSSRYPD